MVAVGAAVVVVGAAVVVVVGATVVGRFVVGAAVVVVVGAAVGAGVVSKIWNWGGEAQQRVSFE